jgi:hypothetical protein
MIYTWQSRASLVSESGLELLAYIWHLKKAFAEYKPCKKQFYNNVYLYIIFYLLYRIPLPLLTIFQTWSCCIHLAIDVTNLIMLYSVHLAIDITNLIMLYSPGHRCNKLDYVVFSSPGHRCNKLDYVVFSSPGHRCNKLDYVVFTWP